ncbi:MAG: ABC transporter substrate-binding protein [Pseudonocardiales bacterium]
MSAPRVGVIGAFSGPRSSWGDIFLTSFKAAHAEESSISWIFCDDAGDESAAEAIALDLVARDAVTVVGHYASFGALRALPHYRAAGVVLLAPAATHPDVTRHGAGLALRLCAVDTAQVGLLRELFGEVLGSRQVLAVHDSTEYGSALATRLAGALPPGRARRLHLDELALHWELSSDYDAVFFSGAHVHGARLLHELRAHGFAGHFAASDDAHIDEFIELAGAASEGAWVVRSQPTFADTTRMAFELVIAALERAPAARGAQLAAVLRRSLPGVRFDEAGEHLGAGWALSRIERGAFCPFPGR